MEGSLDGIFTPLMIYIGFIIGVLILYCCCCYRIAQKRIPTATNENCTYEMAPLPQPALGAAYVVTTLAAVPSRATVETGYHLEPKAEPPPDVRGKSNDELPSYADLYPEY